MTAESEPTIKATPGQWFPLGATQVDGGVNFAVTSSDATSVQVCLFDENGVETRVSLPEQDGGVWHGVVAGGCTRPRRLLDDSARTVWCNQYHTR